MRIPCRVFVVRSFAQKHIVQTFEMDCGRKCEWEFASFANDIVDIENKSYRNNSMVHVYE